MNTPVLAVRICIGLPQASQGMPVGVGSLGCIPSGPSLAACDNLPLKSA